MAFGSQPFGGLVPDVPVVLLPSSALMDAHATNLAPDAHAPDAVLDAHQTNLTLND